MASSLKVVVRNNSAVRIKCTGYSGDWAVKPPQQDYLEAGATMQGEVIIGNQTTPLAFKKDTEKLLTEDAAPSVVEAKSKTTICAFVQQIEQRVAYMYFEFDHLDSSAKEVRCRSFFVCVNITHREWYSFVSAGMASELDPKPTRRPTTDDRWDLYDIFPHGKIGNSTYTPLAGLNFWPKCEVDIRDTDIPDLPLLHGDRHSRWLTDLYENPSTNKKYADHPIARIRLPGSHDAASWKSTWFANARCQDSNLYEQLKLGIRSFDLRLYESRQLNGRKTFWPYHGLKKKGLADQFNKDLNDIGDKTTLLGQIDAFYHETDGSKEFVHLLFTQGYCLFDGLPDPRDPGKGNPPQNEVNDFWTIIKWYFEGKAIKKPSRPQDIPKLKDIGKERFIIQYDDKRSHQPTNDTRAWFNEYVWGAADGMIERRSWRAEVYEQGAHDTKQETIIRFNEDWMRSNLNQLHKREMFWYAQCQITPSSLATAPIDRMFSPDMNLRMMEKFGSWLWIDNASIVSTDFPTAPWVERVIAMNYRGT